MIHACNIERLCGIFQLFSVCHLWNDMFTTYQQDKNHLEKNNSDKQRLWFVIVQFAYASSLLSVVVHNDMLLNNVNWPMTIVMYRLSFFANDSFAKHENDERHLAKQNMTNKTCPVIYNDYVWLRLSWHVCEAVER